jgi:hypothetical protein
MRTFLIHIGLVVALAAGCATAKPVALEPGPQAAAFLVGTWTGSFGWVEEAMTSPRPITVTISAIKPSGEVAGELHYLDLRSGRYGQKYRLRMTVKDGRLEGAVFNWTNVRLERFGNGRLEGDAVTPTVGGIGGLRMAPIVIHLTRAK